MSISDLSLENVKLTVIDNDKNHEDESYMEIVVNRNFLNTAFLCLLLAKGSIPPLNAKLTPREEIVLTEIAKGKDNGSISKTLNVSIHTVKIHIRNIFQKLEVNDRTQAVVKAIIHNLIDIYQEI